MFGQTVPMVKSYFRCFVYENDSHMGYSFPCRSDGTILTDQMHSDGLEYLRQCLLGKVKGRKVVDDGVQMFWTPVLN